MGICRKYVLSRFKSGLGHQFTIRPVAFNVEKLIGQQPRLGAPRGIIGCPYFYIQRRMRMKKLIALILIFVCLFGYTIGDSPATPTDLYEEYMEFEDGDGGYIDIELERQVHLIIDKKPKYLGDTMILRAILIDFKPTDIITFHWQYSKDETFDWIDIEGANESTYTLILDETNMYYWYRVVVNLEGEI